MVQVKNNIISDWLKENINPEIDKLVEKNLAIEITWNKYKETLQESTYMQRLTLKQRKEDFCAGWKAFEEYQMELMNKMYKKK